MRTHLSDIAVTRHDVMNEPDEHVTMNQTSMYTCKLSVDCTPSERIENIYESIWHFINRVSRAAAWLMPNEAASVRVFLPAGAQSGLLMRTRSMTTKLDTSIAHYRSRLNSFALSGWSIHIGKVFYVICTHTWLNESNCKCETVIRLNGMLNSFSRYVRSEMDL